jgi:hypothetical protein
MAKISVESIEKVYGPQSSGDNSFTVKARLLQSIYRVQSGEAMGIGPDQNSFDKYKRPSYYGNMLADGKISGKNFFFRETFDYAIKRADGKTPDETIAEYRLFNNLLSSMPMAFNLFHPLMMIMERFPEQLDQIVRDLFPGLPVYQVDEILIEFIPSPTVNYTNDKSAMDAAILFSDEAQNKYIIATEIKYTDSLGSNKASDKELKITTAKESGLFTKDGLAHIEDGCTQIYRNFLLTEKYRMVHRLKDSYSIVLAPKDHPTTDREIKSLVEYLHPQYKYKLKKYALEDFVFALEKNCPDEFLNWLNWFYDRYLNFEKIASILNEPKQP